MEIKAFIAKANYYFVNDFYLAVRTRDPKVLQPMILFGSMILSMGLSFLSSIITARALGPTNYGNYKYIITVWGLLALLITLGYFYSGTRVLVLEKDPQKSREISGTLILISLLMGMIICLIVILIAYPLDSIFHIDIAKIMVPLAPLIMIFPLSQSLSLILQSINQIYLLAILVGAPSILYIISVLVLSAINQISTVSVILAQQLTSLIIIIVILGYLKPSLNSIRYWLGEIKRHQKTYGTPVYRGSLAGVGTTYLTSLSISYWANNTTMGFFSLATSLVSPLQLIPHAIATSSFRSFASQPKISRKVLLATVLTSMVSMFAAIILFGKPLSWIYTTKFIEVSPLARVLCIAAILIGFGDLFNRFLGAHGQGKPIQNAAYANGIASVICTLIFVPLLGAWGAVLTMIIANGIYFLLLFLSYRTFSHQPTSQ